MNRTTHLRLSGVALAVSGCLSATPSVAATINVDMGCTLRQAITSANSDTVVGSCEAGMGDDTIILPAGPLLYSDGAPYMDAGGDYTAALPPISSNITLQGVMPSGTNIERDTMSAPARLLLVESAASLTLNAVNISGGSENRGGGILAFGNVVLENSSLSNNVASFSGGGISSSDILTLSNSVISGNSAGVNGGGVSGTYATIEVLAGSSISMNVANQYGGGLYLNSGILSVTGSSSVSANIAATGGGMYLYESALTLSDSTVSDNSATASFAGIDAYEPGAVFSLTNATIENNSAAVNGGGLSVRGEYTGPPTSSISIVNSTFNNNQASSGYGGGLYTNYTQTDIQTSNFTNNVSGLGGGAAYVKGLYSVLTVTDSQFTGNAATQPSGNGGAICLEDTETTISGSTLSGNTAGSSGGAIISTQASLSVIKSTLSGNSAGLVGGGLEHSGGSLDLYVSTLSGNKSGKGAAINTDSSAVQIIGSTLFQNITTDAAMDAASLQSTLAPTIINTVIAGSTQRDCNLLSGNIANTNSWFRDASCTGVAQGNPLLNDLLDNNEGLPGMTLTHSPSLSSPLIGAGDSLYCDASVDALFANDQRGAMRSACNIGAVEGAIAGPADVTCFVVKAANGKALSFCL